MKTNPLWRRIIVAGTAVSMSALLLAPSAAAKATRTSGDGAHFWVGWTELDPDDTLGLPGNVHIGYLSGWTDQFGTYIFGGVTDFDCDPGEKPWGGGHGIAEAIVDEGTRVAESAVGAAIDEIIDSGASTIDANKVVDAIQSELAEELPEEILEEVPACDYLQDRFLDGTDTATFTVDIANKIATVNGTLTVTGGHGDHGEPGPVLGRPPVNVSITGGDWHEYKWSYESRGATYKYSDKRDGTDLYGGTVTGAIGAMGFADDPDDESYGGFGAFRYRTVEKVRG